MNVVLKAKASFQYYAIFGRKLKLFKYHKDQTLPRIVDKMRKSNYLVWPTKSSILISSTSDKKFNSVSFAYSPELVQGFIDANNASSVESYEELIKGIGMFNNEKCISI